MSKLILIALAAIGFQGCVIGCASKAPDAETMLTMLQQGKFSGNVTATSDGRASVSQSLHFGIGAEHSSFAFDGHLDFADTVRHVSGELPAPEGVPGG